MTTRSKVPVALLLSLAAVACGGTEAAFNHKGAGAPGADDLTSTNGMSTNGMSTNGMSTNGMSTNGMSTNGMSTNGLATLGLSVLGLASNTFSSWFGQNPSYSDMVMRYTVRCALPAGQSLSFNYRGTNYTWAGNLNLAPGWLTGAIGYNDQQVISACLAAHANKYGVEVPISVRGYNSWGNAVPVTSAEAAAYTADEGCFFGNLFDGTGVYAAVSANSPLANDNTTSLRACTMSAGDWGQCNPMMNAQATVQQVCSGGNMSTGYWNCQVNGVSYRPVCVRLQPSQFNVCGDGVCQNTESCYDWRTGNGCKQDCGSCR